MYRNGTCLNDLLIFQALFSAQVKAAWTMVKLSHTTLSACGQ